MISMLRGSTCVGVFNFISRRYSLPNLLFRCWMDPIHLDIGRQEEAEVKQDKTAM